MNQKQQDRPMLIRHLPSRRNAPTISFNMFDGYTSQDYEAQFAEFEDGELAEVFMRPVGGANGKPGSPLDTMAKDLSVLFSIARRYGAPIDVIMAALSQQANGEMLGPLGEFLCCYRDLPKDDPPPVPVPVPVGTAVAEVA